MNPSERACFLKERATCIGGSDAQHLVGQSPWGCRRRLWFDKSQVVADYPFEGTAHTRRGAKLEPIAVEEYRELTQRTIEPASFVRHAHRPHMGVHLDRTVQAPAFPGPGVLEVKVPTSRYYMAIKAGGIPRAYWLQAQWGMACSGFRWASVCVFSPEWMSVLVTDFLRDEVVIAEMEDQAELFWSSLGAGTNPEPALADGSAACKSCPWRGGCKAMALYERAYDGDEAEAIDRDYTDDEALAGLIRLVGGLRRERGTVEKHLRDAESQLKSRLEGRAVRSSAGTVHLRVYDRKEYTVKAQTVRQLVVVPLVQEEELDDAA